MATRFLALIMNIFPSKSLVVKGAAHEWIVTEPVSERDVSCGRMVDCHTLPASRIDLYWEGTGRDVPIVLDTRGSAPI
jgi:hypothetical protein